MSFNVLETVNAALSGEITTKMAGKLGESNATVQQALQVAIPSILTGILMKAKGGNLSSVRELVMKAAWQADENDDSSGMDLLKSLFGERTADISGAIAGNAGLSQESALSVMRVAAPVTLGILGKHVLVSDMNMEGLRSLLQTQKKSILSSCPPGIFSEGFMNSQKFLRASRRFNAGHIPKRKTKWLLPAIIICIAAAVGGYYFPKFSKVTRPAKTSIAAPVAADSSSLKPVAAEKVIASKPPEPYGLDFSSGTMEAKLVEYLRDPTSSLTKKFSFDLDQVHFIKNKAVITEQSQTQIRNIAKILNEFPKARIKIGAFNGNEADETDSMISEDLSESRAAAVSAALKSAGAKPSQIAGYGGFGANFAKYPATAPDSLKAKDNRLSISVRAK